LHTQVLSPLAGTLRDGVEQQAAVESTLGLCMLMWMLICEFVQFVNVPCAVVDAGHERERERERECTQHDT
jgi:hypothetical protein